MAASIGRYCSINSTAHIWNSHPMNYISTHPFLDYKYRFKKEDIDWLEQVKWWDWSIEEIEKNMELFYQPEYFLQRVKDKIIKKT